MPVPLLNQPFSKWAQANIGVSIHLQEDFCVCSLPTKLVNIFCVVCRMPVGIINLGIPQCPFLHFAKSGVQVTSASGKSRLASVGRIFKFRGAKTPQTVDTQGFQPMASILFAGSGGDGEIRTLDTLLRYTRFPIVRARPATRHLHIAVSSRQKLLYPLSPPKSIENSRIFEEFSITLLPPAGTGHWAARPGGASAPAKQSQRS